MGISNTTMILLASFVVALSQIPIHLADTHQAYKEESFVDMIDPKIGVKIQNIMGNGSGEQISVHCKSQKDDLGTHILRPKESIQWRFPPSKFLYTPFNCNVTWGQHSVSFDAYDFWRDSGSNTNRCMQCVWSVSKDSIVGEGLWPYPDLIIKWPKN